MKTMPEKLVLMYKKLYACFGPQHWWPGETPFEVAVGAILTQNTNWSNVEKAIANLKKDKVLNPRALHDMSHEPPGFAYPARRIFQHKGKKTEEFHRITN